MDPTTVDGGDGDRKVRVVKRYANRKLYDTRESRYVTLQQIAELVRGGEDVRIIDNRTKEDLTDVTLAQIIYEEQKEGKRSAWSVKTLKALVQQGGDRLMSSLKHTPVVRLVTRATEEAEEAEAAEAEAAEAAEGADADHAGPAVASADVNDAGGGFEAEPEPRVDARGTPRTESGPEPGKKGIVAKSREAWDELSRMTDDRVKTLVTTALGQVKDLQGEVKRLQARVQELEEKLVKVTRRGGKAGEPEE